MVKSKCLAPYQCDNDTLLSPELTVSCRGDLEVEKDAFGIQASEFQGDRGYADFLFSLTDNPFLFRGGEVRSTRDFIDSATQTAKVILVFFTPDSGLTSVLTWTSEFMENAAAEGSVTLQHYEMLEGSELSSYLAVQIIVLFFVVLIVIDSLNDITQMVVCVCVCVCVCVHTHTCMYVYLHNHAYIHACARIKTLTHSLSHAHNAPTHTGPHISEVTRTTRFECLPQSRHGSGRLCQYNRVCSDENPHENCLRQ